MKRYFMTTEERLRDRVKVAMGERKADLVFKNASFINLFSERIEKADIAICRRHIVGIGEYDGEVEVDCTNKIVSPSFIDSHIHLESAMISPRSFRDLVVCHGTAGVIVDPHEIANVAGIDGINYILNMTEDLDLYVGVMVPSCVPSTPLDESGATLTADDIKPLYENRRIYGLAEMMNAYGLIHGDEQCIKKSVDAINAGKLIDGHAPGIVGRQLNAYLTSAISSDHECSDIKEAIDKLERGMWIQIREGTVCKDLDALMDLFKAPYHNRCMLATDDSHPDTIINDGHIDRIVRKAISNGADPIKAIKMGSLNPAIHYGLDHVGAIGIGYMANLIVLDDLETFKIHSCYLAGKKVSEYDKVLYKYSDEMNTLDKVVFKRVYHSFNLDNVKESDFEVKKTGSKERVIEIVPGGVLTKEVTLDIIENKDLPYGVDTDRNIAKIAVVERHHATGHIGVGFIKGYGIRQGAIASSIGHDSHNIIVVGVNDKDIAMAVNTVKNNNGGIAIVCNSVIQGELKLEVAGLMTENDENYVISNLEKLKDIAYYDLGVKRDIDPFMTLAFMQLPVIPDLKIIPKGLVKVSEQKIVEAVF